MLRKKTITSLCILIKRIKLSSVSLQRRFVLYTISAIVACIMLCLLLLSFLGILNPATAEINEFLSEQLENNITQYTHDIDELAAYSISFSKLLSDQIDSFLVEKQLSFDQLTNNTDALTSLQKKAYSTVYTNLQIAPCSGAFYILNATVNDGLSSASFNGIYLKYANIYAENTINTKPCLFRGFSEIARVNNINLHSTWQNEMDTDAFSNIEQALQTDANYYLSNVTKLPGTWERARYIYTPIYDLNQHIIGICGFEMSDLYLKLSYNVSNQEGNHAVCALLNKQGNSYEGQYISNRSGFIPTYSDIISIEKYGDFYLFKSECDDYIGNMVELQQGSNTLIIALMLPKQDYDATILKGRIKAILIFFILAIVAILTCFLLSRKYISPIIKSIEQIKYSKDNYKSSGILEIDDLFEFLAEQDRKNDLLLTEMENEQAKIKASLEQMQNDHSKVQQKLERLGYSKKSDVDPDDYENFLEGIKTLTKTERYVFDLYLEGKSAADIMEIMSIKQSTIKYHNHNILGKLGVSSRKQMLLYATLMQEQELNQ